MYLCMASWSVLCGQCSGLQLNCILQDSTGEAAAQAQKHLTYYELDLGLNHVIRKASEPIDNGANLLIPVPGGADGPSGVLVCAENFIMYRSVDTTDEVRTVIPRRSDLLPERGVLIVSYAMHKRKNMFFFLVQVRLPLSKEYILVVLIVLNWSTLNQCQLKIVNAQICMFLVSFRSQQKLELSSFVVYYTESIDAPTKGWQSFLYSLLKVYRICCAE